jgi:hypothetical protein
MLWSPFPSGSVEQGFAFGPPSWSSLPAPVLVLHAPVFFGRTRIEGGWWLWWCGEKARALTRVQTRLVCFLVFCTMLPALDRDQQGRSCVVVGGGFEDYSSKDLILPHTLSEEDDDVNNCLVEQVIRAMIEPILWLGVIKQDRPQPPKTPRFHTSLKALTKHLKQSGSLLHSYADIWWKIWLRQQPNVSKSGVSNVTGYAIASDRGGGPMEQKQVRRTSRHAL